MTASASSELQDLRVRLRIAERGEGALDPGEADRAGHDGRRVHLALGQEVQRVTELDRCVAEHLL